MKKIFKPFTMVFLFTVMFLFNNNVLAANLNVSITSSTSRAVVGNNITYTVRVSSNAKFGNIHYRLEYDTSKLTHVSGTLNNFDLNVIDKYSATYTFTFRAKASGNARVTFVINEALELNNNSFNYNTRTNKDITIITQQQLEASYSKNNYLSSLKIDNFEMTPAFNKDTLEYSIELENDVKSINISGTKADSTASVEGLGAHELIEGPNKINIKVTAQNGASRTYTINATVKELNPIIVTVDGKEYNVVRKKDLIKKPNSKYEETIIQINEEDVPAFINETTKVTLIGLRDEEDNISLFSVKNDTYIPYQEFAFSSIIFTEENLDDLPKGYTKTKLKLEEVEIDAYQDNSNLNFYLIKGVNIETGITSLYQYDSKENTLQIYNDSLAKQNKELTNKNNIYLYTIIGLIALIAISSGTILVKTLKNEKPKIKKEEKTDKKVKEKVEEPKEPIIEEESLTKQIKKMKKNKKQS